MKPKKILKLLRLSLNWLCAVPMVITVAALFALPGTIPAHYNSSGNIDRYGSKYELLALPATAVFMHLFLRFIAKTFPIDMEKRPHKVLFWSSIAVNGVFTVLTAWILWLTFSNI